MARRRAGRAYPPEVKAEGLRMAAEGVPLAQIARQLGTSLQTPRNWILAERKAGGAVLSGARGPGRVGGRRAPAAPTAQSRDERLLASIKAAIREYIASVEL